MSPIQAKNCYIIELNIYLFVENIFLNKFCPKLDFRFISATDLFIFFERKLPK